VPESLAPLVRFGTLVAFLPVITFLVSLLLLDSFKLVRLRAVLLGIGAGVIAATISYFANGLLAEATGLSPAPFSRYAAPLVEEILKGSYLFLLIRHRRVGFMVDAAIMGFAVGAGFGIAENMHYVQALEGTSLPVLVLRGFGTAIMHGGTTALFAVLSKNLSERHRSLGARTLLPGLAIAYFLHSLYNHFPISPALSAATVLLLLPAVLAIVFRRSESSLREWLGVGFDTDAELLETIRTGRISDTRIGEYLKTLTDHFAPEVVADMLCLLHIRTELSIRAKGVLMMREAGFRPEPDPAIESRFLELRYLEKSIGKTGLLALHPCHRWSDRDLWQLHMLGRS
jgi:RsiW-degrading membrane proteinase PrsW (M82 family)